MIPKLSEIDLYFITDSRLTKKTVLDDVRAAINSGVKIIQYREKEKSTELMLKVAREIKELCKDKAIFLIDDRIDIALAVDADGVHLGHKDMPYETARKLLGNKIIGLSTHKIEQSLRAEQLGADYIGVGPIFETNTKADAGPAVGLKLIEEVKKRVNIPFVAIGGIKLDNIDHITKAGATSAAVISGIVTKEDVEAECKKFIDKLKK